MERDTKEKRPRINFRPALFCALSLAFGIFLYGKIRFGGLSFSDFAFVLLFFGFALFPLSKRRALALFVCLAVFAGAGALGAFLSFRPYASVMPDGEYRLSGTAVSVSVKRGYSVVILSDLYFDGERQGGSCRVIVEGEVLPADLLTIDAAVTGERLEGFAEDPYVRSNYAQGIRYYARARSAEKTGRSSNPFLRLNAALYSLFHEHMEKDEADLAYALLTGNSGSLDEGVSEAVRRGGIAHIFAVSGLHIGALYAAVYFLFRRLGKYRFLPALFAALCYSALCNFTVSSVRAVVMCGVLSANRAFGRKHDFLSALSFAALAILLFRPSQWYSAGMRLSFGACLGLALFADPLVRLFSRLRLPRPLAGYLAADLAVQLFTLPILLDSFGYFSVWGLLLNPLIIPLMPVLFPVILVLSLLALIVPPAAGVLLLLPEGAFTLLLLFVTTADLSFVVTGFALGAGSLVYLVACVALSGRFRLSVRGKCVAAAVLAVLFGAVVALENVVPSGVRIDVYTDREDASAALVRTPHESVLLIDGEMSLEDCRTFLSRTYGGTLDLVVVLAEDEVSGFNTAVFLGARAIRLRDEAETGLGSEETLFGEAFSCGGLSFRYATREKMLLFAEGTVVEFDFGGKSAFSPDLFVDGARSGLKYFLKDGILYSRGSARG